MTWLQLAEHLKPYPDVVWDLAKQCGVTHAVTSYPDDSPEGHGWEPGPLRATQRRFRDAGLELAVIETGFPWLHDGKVGGPNADAEIARCQEVIRTLGGLGVPVVCWNFMAMFNWTRTDLGIPARGGALVTGYDHTRQAQLPFRPEHPVSEAQLWENLTRVMEAIVPVAEEAGVFLALHPDDPPISPILGVGRILTSPEAMLRAVELVPSRHNGITFCQGTFSTMGADVPAEIRRFGGRGLVPFVHFRDVRGRPEKFVETFHDAGQTDMLAALRTWKAVGFHGPMRPDHVPTMAGEENLAPGYQTLGRLFALGYITGLLEAVGRD